jgi:hypothetical protein
MNFPSSPTNGQQYTFNGRTWEWNGSAWQILSPLLGTTGIADGAVTGPKLSSTIAIPSGATGITPAAGDNDTSLATTAFVQSEKKFKQMVAATTISGEQAISANGWVAATGYSVTITPSSTSSKILIAACIPWSSESVVASGDGGAETWASFQIRRGTTVIRNALGDSSGQPYEIGGTVQSSGTPVQISLGGIANLLHVDSPNTTSATTYDIRAAGYSFSTNVMTTLRLQPADTTSPTGTMFAMEIT